MVNCFFQRKTTMALALIFAFYAAFVFGLLHVTGALRK